MPHKRHLDFLDILLKARTEDEKSLDDLVIRNEVDTFLFEGEYLFPVCFKYFVS